MLRNQITWTTTMNGVLSQSESSPRLGLIGNPENRRIADFQNAVEELGWPRPPCLAYEELLAHPETLDSLDADVLRVDSPGENARLANALIALGGGPATSNLEFGEINYTKEYHRGFCAVLQK